MRAIPNASNQGNPNDVVFDAVDKLLSSRAKEALKKGGRFDLLKTNWSEMLHIEQLDVDDKEPLRVEQEAFLRAVADEGERPEVSAEEALAAMKCAEMILASIKEHKWD